MIKKLLLFTFSIALLGFFAVALQSNVSAKKEDKVTICHATASNSNPYVTNTVDISSLGDGHGHNGVNSGDIIPPTPGTDFPNGQNWDTNGQAIYNNDCNVPAPTATPTIDPCVSNPSACLTPTATPSATPTATPSATPTATPSASPTSTPTPTPGNSGCTDNCGGSNNNSNNSGGGSSSSSSSSSNSQPIQAVLGASTMAETGTFETNLMNAMLIAGIAVLGLGSLSYAKKK